jgi:putative alpha-1,2-mannosidase
MMQRGRRSSSPACFKLPLRISSAANGPLANDVTTVMGGDSPAPLISTAYAFGARSFNARTALRYMLKAATQPGTGLHGYAERPRLAEY